MSHTTFGVASSRTHASANETPLTTTASQPSWFQRLARRKLVRWLSELENGAVHFTDSTMDDADYGYKSEDFLQASWTVHDPKFYSRLATGGSIGIAESYLQGEWGTDDLTSLLQILCRNLHRTQIADSGLASIAYAIRRLLNRMDGNTINGSQRHIASHYDLSNDFFELFLDPSLMYSCAYFARSDATLHEASLAKLDQICSKLQLHAADNVLEIGTGWGGFALYAIENFGCEITTTTISAAQFRKAQQRFRDADVDRHVTLLSSDYRELAGKYDKLVSIEMVEAVG
ncbi:MAG: class I SAM-dependent methyltransferase, partial [Aeoliella sp.]